MRKRPKRMKTDICNYNSLLKLPIMLVLKTLFPLACALALAACPYRYLPAQTAERTVLANAGGGASIAGGRHISWTLGEDFVATRASANAPVVYVTEGFQQPNSGTVPTVDLPDAIGQVTVSPNPAGDALSITFQEAPPAGLRLRAHLADAGGRILREVEIADPATTLDLRGLPPAWYALVLTDGNTWVRSVGVVKQ